ncbi:hypothetical protein V1283_003540 [Bradyrhizobium sp. AZCC 2262]|uniref:hypothetical protein n=1 Tax=Bradyrhizobium sp. AZCC 2262 TaxID=3117022 RepID=UPI002FF40F70
MRVGSLQRVVCDDGVGRLRLVDDTGAHFVITRKMMRETGVVRPLAGATFEFLVTSDGHAAQLRAIS